MMKVIVDEVDPLYVSVLSACMVVILLVESAADTLMLYRIRSGTPLAMISNNNSNNSDNSKECSLSFVLYFLLWYSYIGVFEKLSYCFCTVVRCYREGILIAFFLPDRKYLAPRLHPQTRLPARLSGRMFYFSYL